jgi:2-C-methyl-D-erythritol 2,4-cyclodiphosphate synthase
MTKLDEWRKKHECSNDKRAVEKLSSSFGFRHSFVISPMIRSGIGYDIHRLADGLKLILGGVEIAHARGLEGHSDADVLSHAIADALLGAIGAGDIGQHFPNTDESIRGISSMEILKRVGSLLNEKNARVINVDATVIAEAPKLVPHVPAMRQEIAAAIGVSESDVSVKATTNEKLGPIGQGEGIAAIAIATIEILGSGD